MSAIQELQDWYFSQCDENWEHTYGVSIGTLDNPGWSVMIDLTGTDLTGKAFPVHSYGVGGDSNPNGNNWIVCKIERNKFVGNGGPMKLEEILNVFLSWAKSDA